MSEWLEDRVVQIRERMTPDDEASLWTLFFDDPEGEPAVASVIDGAMHEMNLELVRRFAEVTADVGALAVLFAVIRRDGYPRPEDRQLWRRLRVLLSNRTTRTLGFVVVGQASWWAATGDSDLGTVA